MNTAHFGRAVTESPWKAQARGQSLTTLADSDDLISSGEEHVPRRRCVTEPAPSRPKERLIDALNGVESSLPFSRPVKSAVVSKSQGQAWLVNGLLCIISLITGGLTPVLVDMSKTGVMFMPGGAQVNIMPYSVLSLLRSEATFNVLLGLVAIALTKPKGGLQPLFDWKSHQVMFPLTLIYCLGDIAAICAIGGSGGPMYIAVASSRLLFAAGVSRILLGRRQTVLQWCFLCEMTFATAVYAILQSKNKAADDGVDTTRAMIGICWAVAKALLSGMAAVLTETRYKNLNVWHANTLLKGQSLAVALLVTGVRFCLVTDTPLCNGSKLDGLKHACVDHKGWDAWTWAVLAAEIGAGWLSVAVLTRMSAISKYICKTATAPTLYLLYCTMGWDGYEFEGSCFFAVMMIAWGIMAYLLEPYIGAFRARVDAVWTAGYAKPR